LSILGYTLDFNSLVNKKIVNDKTMYFVESSTEKKIVPNFLIDNEDSLDDLNSLLKGLKLVGDYMDKTIMKPNNINFPVSRNLFINSLK
jgi:DNA repair protein RecO (recombination protein O)